MGEERGVVLHFGRLKQARPSQARRPCWRASEVVSLSGRNCDGESLVSAACVAPKRGNVRWSLITLGLCAGVVHRAGSGAAPRPASGAATTLDEHRPSLGLPSSFLDAFFVSPSSAFRFLWSGASGPGGSPTHADQPRGTQTRRAAEPQGRGSSQVR